MPETIVPASVPSLLISRFSSCLEPADSKLAAEPAPSATPCSLLFPPRFRFLRRLEPFRPPTSDPEPSLPSLPPSRTNPEPWAEAGSDVSPAAGRRDDLSDGICDLQVWRTKLTLTPAQTLPIEAIETYPPAMIGSRTACRSRPRRRRDRPHRAFRPELSARMTICSGSALNRVI